MRKALVLSGLLAATLCLPRGASAQYAVGHHAFGGGTAFGVGFSKMDLQFTGPDVVDSNLTWLLPTIELKYFLSDRLSIDLSVPVANIAASNAMREYFFFTAEAFVNFHPSAPSSFELFVAPGIGFSYAYDSWEDKTSGLEYSEDAWAFHIPARVGFEFNSARRGFSFFVAVKPFFNLVHGAKGDIKAGGGGMLELGVMAYAVRYRQDRY